MLDTHMQGSYAYINNRFLIKSKSKCTSVIFYSKQKTHYNININICVTGLLDYDYFEVMIIQDAYFGNLINSSYY